MKPNLVIWFEIFVQDMKRAVEFYENILQIKMHELEKPPVDALMTFFSMEQNIIGAGGALVKMDCMPSGNNSTQVYFSCEDCAVEGSRVEKSGGKIKREKMSIGEYGFIVLAIDTEGNTFGLHSLK